MTGTGIEGAMWYDFDVSAWRPSGRIWEVDQYAGYYTEWHCEPPPVGASYRVIRDSWREVVTGRVTDFTVVLEMPDGREITVDPGREKIPVRSIYAWSYGHGDTIRA